MENEQQRFSSVFFLIELAVLGDQVAFWAFRPCFQVPWSHVVEWFP